MTPTRTRRPFTLSRTLLVGACALLLGPVAGCDLDDEPGQADVVDTSTSNPTSATISFEGDYTFQPNDVTISSGGTVTFTNNSDIELNLNIETIYPNGEVVPIGTSDTVTFSAPGQYLYFDANLNEDGGGTITVQ